MDDYLTKPLVLEVLKECLYRWFSLSQQSYESELIHESKKVVASASIAKSNALFDRDRALALMSGDQELLDEVLTRYIESQVYRGAVENFACEMAAKMVAMKSATDNAGEIIEKLQLDYNKARQAAITQEISEIVGGAAAVSG